MIGRRTLLAAGVAGVAGGIVAVSGPRQGQPEGIHHVRDRDDLIDALRRVVGDDLAETRAAADWAGALMEITTGEAGHVALDAVLASFMLSTTAAAAWEDGHDPIFLGLHTPTTPCVNGLSAAFAPA